MIKFKSKIRKIGNSYGVIIPKNVITSLNLDEEIEINVITPSDSPEDLAPIPAVSKKRPILAKKPKLCPKHQVNPISCGCY